MPSAAYAGPKKLMELVSPAGPYIRPAPSAEIHWPWPAAWRRSNYFRKPERMSHWSDAAQCSPKD